MVTVASLGVKIGADLKDFQKGMAQMEGQLKQVGQNLRSVGATLSRSVTLPILGIAGAAVKAASDVEEMRDKFNVVFKTVGGSVSKELGNFAEQVNRSRYDLMGFAATFGDIIKPMGFTEESAANMSVTLTKLAVDLSSFNNMPMDEAVRRLRGTLIGAHENAADFGVIINENTLKQELMRMGADKLTGAQKEQAKVQARLNLLLAGTTDAHGNAADTSGTFAGQMRGLAAATKDLGIQVGEMLLPYATELVGIMRGLVERFEAMSPEAKKVALALVGLAAAIGPALFILGGMAAGFSAIIGAMGTLAALANPVVLAFAAIAAIGIAVYRNWDAVTLAFNGTYTAITELVDNLKTNFVTTLSGIFGAVGLAITGKFTEAWDMLKETASAGATDVVSDLSTFATDAGAAVAPLATALVTDPFQIGDFFETGLVADITDKATSIVGDFGSVEQSVNDVDNMNPTFEGITDALQGQSVPSIVLSAFYAGQGIKGVSDQVAILEKVKPDFSNITANVAEIETKASAASIKLQEMVDELIPDELTNPYVGIIESATPEEGQIEKIGRFQERMRLLSLDLANASHHARQLDMRIGDVESAWRPLFGTDSPQWMKDLSKYASDATLIVTGLEAMVELLKPSTWTDALSVLKDLGEGLWNIVTAIGEIILKIAQWVLAQAGIGGAGPDFTGGAPGIIIPGSGGDATTTAAGGTGAGLGLLGGATFGATLGIFAWGLGQMLDNTWNSLIEQGVDPAQLGTATSLGGLLQGVGSMGGTGSGTPSWLSGLQGYMGTGGSANTSGIMGSGSMGSTQTININLDGQQIATATVPYMAGELELYGTNY